MARVQRLLFSHIEAMGGKHVYISRAFVPPAGSGLHGFTWEGVNLSLNSLVRLGTLRVAKGNFFYLSAHCQQAGHAVHRSHANDQPNGSTFCTPLSDTCACSP